jgi:hypothetical protein
MESCGKRSRVSAVAVRAAVVLALLGAMLLGGCVSLRKEARPGNPPPDPMTIRLPVGTPLKIEQEAPPPISQQSVAPDEIREGQIRALKLFRIDLGYIPAEPLPEDVPGIMYEP